MPCMNAKVQAKFMSDCCAPGAMLRVPGNPAPSSKPEPLFAHLSSPHPLNPPSPLVICVQEAPVQCGSNPCKKGETCTNSGCSYKCSNPCSSKPCENGGTCVPWDDGSGYTCDCGCYTGDRCQVWYEWVWACECVCMCVCVFRGG